MHVVEELAVRSAKEQAQAAREARADYAYAQTAFRVSIPALKLVDERVSFPRQVIAPPYEKKALSVSRPLGVVRVVTLVARHGKGRRE